MEQKDIKIVREIKRMGTSLGIRIGVEPVNLIGLKEGDIIEATIRKRNDFAKGELIVICPKCNATILTGEENDIVDCPVCGETELRVNELKRGDKNGRN